MNEGIVQALKNINHNLRLSNHNRWMVWDYTSNKWCVYKSKRGGMGHQIISTRDEGEAVHHLLDEN